MLFMHVTRVLFMNEILLRVDFCGEKLKDIVQTPGKGKLKSGIL